MRITSCLSGKDKEIPNPRNSRRNAERRIENTELVGIL